MRLLRLELRDWVSYDRLDLDLSGVSEVALVGPVGSGKSALQNAAQWALYGEARGVSSRAERMIRDGARIARVRSTWDHDGSEVVVTRVRDMTSRAGSTSLVLEVDGEDVSRHTIAETQRAIEELVGVPLDGLLAGPFMEADSPAGIMDLDPGPRKDLMFRLRGLDRFAPLAERCRSAAASVAGELAAILRERDRLDPLAAAVADNEAEVLRASESIALLDRAIEEDQRAAAALQAEAAAAVERERRAEDLVRAHREAAGRRERAVERRRTVQEEAARRRAVLEADAPPGPGVDVAALETAAELADLDRSAYALAAGERDRLRAAWSQADAKARMLPTVPCHGEGIYATCRFLADAADAAAQVPELLRVGAESAARAEALSGADVRYRTIAAELAQARRLEADAAVAEARRSAAEAWLEDADDRLRQHDEEVAALVAAEAEAGVAAREAAVPPEDGDRIAREARAITGRLVEAQARRASVAADLREAEASLAVARDAARRVAELDAQAAEQEREHAVQTVLAGAFGRDGIPTLMFEGMVPAFEAAVNEALASMPGGFRVEVRTTEERRSGVVREELGITVALRGRERDYRMLSMGQRLTVDVAVRVAVSEGLRWGTFWLDEPAGNLDAEYREGLIELAASLRDRFPLVVVATHQDIGDRLPAVVRTSIDQATGISSAVVE